MRFLKLAAFAFLFVSNTAIAQDPTPLCPPGYWCEMGDAGDKSSPQDITGGPYIGFRGFIGTPDIGIDGAIVTPDVFDAFRFRLDGTSLLTQTFLLPPDSLAFTPFTPFPPFPPPITIGTALYTDGPNPGFIDPEPGAASLPFGNSKTWLGLTDGATYIIEFEYNGSDPPFTMTNLGPSSINAAAAIPEPSTWALMLAGLAGILVMSRRRISH